MTKLALFQRCTDSSNMQINKCYNLNKWTQIQQLHAQCTSKKNLDKMQHTFIIRVMERLGMEEAFLDIMKAIYYKLIANIMLNREKFRYHH